MVSPHRVLTGVKPTADQLHVGNYFGAIAPLLSLQEKYDDIFVFVPDMHATTTMYDPDALRTNIYNIVRTYMACGLDPDRVIIYKQSDIPGHAQLHWILSCLTTMGFMERMHAYKAAKDQGTNDTISVGTFCYPVLMASDILLYDATHVPVGKDQKQHVEFARDIAQKFNNTYGDLFVLPEPMIHDKTATVPGLDGRKMSKSYNNFIGLFDATDTVVTKIKKISTSPIPIHEPKDPDTCTLYALLSLFLSDQEQRDVRHQYELGGFSYKDGKTMLIDRVCDFLAPIQERRAQRSDRDISHILTKGADHVRPYAQDKIAHVYKACGYTM